MRALNHVWVALFVVGICMPAMGLLIAPDAMRFAEVERRAPDACAIALDDKLQANVTKCLEDRVLFRFELLKGLSRLVYLTGSSPKPALGVPGRGPWLFLGDFYDAGISKYRGINGYFEAQLSRVPQLLSVASATQRQGVPLSVFFVPDKHRAYADRLPTWLRADPRPSRMTRTVEALRAEHVEAFELSDAVAWARHEFDPRPVYGETDSHWNVLGAFGAARQIAGHLTATVEGDGAFPLTVASVVEAPSEVGDVARFLQLTVPTSRFELAYDPPAQPVKQRMQGVEQTLSPHFRIIGAMQPVLVVNDRAPISKRVLFLRDSMGDCLSEVTNQLFTESIHLHYEALFSVKSIALEALLDEFKPDAVVVVMVERTL